jgi:predicted CopG family antitoxin
MSNLESNVFGKKKFSDILKEIYENQKKKETANYRFDR